MKKSLFLILNLVLFVEAKELCNGKISCEDVNSKCQCYCEVGRTYRDKVVDRDHPIYFNAEEDPYGKGCYCGPRDLKVFEAVEAGMSYDDAVKQFKDFFPNAEESKQIKQYFLNKKK